MPSSAVEFSDEELRWFWTITRVMQREGQQDDEQAQWTANLVAKLEDEIERRGIYIAEKM